MRNITRGPTARLGGGAFAGSTDVPRPESWIL